VYEGLDIRQRRDLARAQGTLLAEMHRLTSPVAGRYDVAADAIVA
jgi:hypothetical protein